MAIGNPAIAALKTGNKLVQHHAAVVNARFIKPLDRDMVLTIAGASPDHHREENALQEGSERRHRMPE
jgi:deoxyxylulose-5-phosphate synthase